MRLGNRIALAVIVAALLIRFGPHAGVLPEPEGPRTGLVVVAAEDSDNRSKLPQEQIDAWLSEDIRGYLREHCAKDQSGNAEFRFVDEGASFEHEPKPLQDAWAKKHPPYPWLGIMRNGKLVAEGEFPPDVQTLKAKLEKYGRE